MGWILHCVGVEGSMHTTSYIRVSPPLVIITSPVVLSVCYGLVVTTYKIILGG